MVEIAVATQTAPVDWWDESDEVLATVMDVLEIAHRKTKRKG